MLSVGINLNRLSKGPCEGLILVKRLNIRLDNASVSTLNCLYIKLRLVLHYFGHSNCQDLFIPLINGPQLGLCGYNMDKLANYL